MENSIQCNHSLYGLELTQLMHAERESLNYMHFKTKSPRLILGKPPTFRQGANQRMYQDIRQIYRFIVRTFGDT